MCRDDAVGRFLGNAHQTRDCSSNAQSLLIDRVSYCPGFR